MLCGRLYGAVEQQRAQRTGLSSALCSHSALPAVSAHVQAAAARCACLPVHLPEALVDCLSCHSMCLFKTRGIDPEQRLSGARRDVQACNRACVVLVCACELHESSYIFRHIPCDDILTNFSCRHGTSIISARRGARACPGLSSCCCASAPASLPLN